MLHNRIIKGFIILTALFSFLSIGSHAIAQNTNSSSNSKIKRVIEHWTQERITNAIPRDLVIDERGLGYIRKPDGSLEPYGHKIASSSGQPKPMDEVAPSITDMDPLDGATIGYSHAFSANVTDLDGIKSVKFSIIYPDDRTQNFSPSYQGDDIWSIDLQGFSNGNWSWQVIAKDRASRGGNTAISEVVEFTVDTSGSGNGGSESTGGDTGDSSIITNAEWPFEGDVQTAAGRIYFEMPGNSKWKGPWNGYVCSGTVVIDDTSGRSIIITAAHCVYDDANKAFARNVLFIPDQDGTSASGTDLNCSNDPLGCWVPRFGVVDQNWADSTFPNNIEWDYAYYVVSDTGYAHSTGFTYDNEVLDNAVGSLVVSFAQPNYDLASDTSDLTHALGYSYSEDPNFMYCAEEMTTEGGVNWWLASCDLSGGSSGGPWVQPMDKAIGNGPIISINSWGYTTSSGMAGPKLNGTSAECLFTIAKDENFGSFSGDGLEGIAVDNCP